MKSILQTKEWTEFKAKFGWSYTEVNGIFVLKKGLPFGSNMLYAPEVYLPPRKVEETVAALVAEAEKDKHCAFFTLEILNPHDECPLDLKPLGFTPSFEDIQPRWRQIIPLDLPAEKILAQMKEKGRYNVRLSEKKGIVCHVHDELLFLEDDVKIFYNLMAETAKRDGFSIRPKNYFLELLQMLYKNKTGFMVSGAFEDITLAATIISVYDNTATYLYGASGSVERNRMASYGVQFKAMREAKDRGTKKYDLLAISPEDGLNSALAKKYTGITKFKENFGGKKIAIAGGFTKVFKPTFYKLYKQIEKIRRGL